jgi:hypothetical protein
MSWTDDAYQSSSPICIASLARKKWKCPAHPGTRKTGRQSSFGKPSGIVRFDPPELHGELSHAIEVWKRMVNPPSADYFSDDLVDVTLPDFDPAEHADITITSQTEFELLLHGWEDSIPISYGAFIKLAKELSQARLVEGYACWTNARYLLRVAPANDSTYAHMVRLLPEPESKEEREAQLAYVERDRERRSIWEELRQPLDRGIYAGEEGFDEDLAATWEAASKEALELAGKIDKPTMRYFAMPVTHDGIDATCCLTAGFTVFGAAVAASGEYDKAFPPILSGEVFVEVRFRAGEIAEDSARYCADAYLFELSSSVGLDFEVDPRPTLDYEDPEELDWRHSYDVRLRPLMLGMGMPELLRLYNRAAVATDDEIKVLYFAKVMEYVSRTVVNQRAYEVIRAKLLSPRSLSPDVSYVAELQAVVEEQRVFRKDREAVRQATIACCEASEIAGAAPQFLAKLRKVSPEDAPKKKEEALAELGASLYATRNRVAHAKADYEPTGEECPEEQMPDFAECAKLAAQQAVRWYHSRPENARVL